MRSRFFFIGPHPSTIGRVWIREINPFSGLIFKIWCPICAGAASPRKIITIPLPKSWGLGSGPL